MSFNDVWEIIKSLPFEEKQESQALLAQYLREERREEIYINGQQSRLEEQRGELKFSSKLDELKQLLEESRWKAVLVHHFDLHLKNESKVKRI